MAQIRDDGRRDDTMWPVETVHMIVATHDPAPHGFESVFREWQGRLGLGHWDIRVESAEFTKKTNAIIWCHEQDNCAFVRYNADLTENYWVGTAIHELLHVILRDYTAYAEDTRKGDPALLRLEEQVVYRLSRMIVRAASLPYEVDWDGIRPEE